MNKGIIIFTFALGAAVGSIATWRFLKPKYEQLVQEEIASVKEALGRGKPKTEDEKQSEEPISTKDKKSYEQITKNYHAISNMGKEKNDDMTEQPYVISPDEFGDQDDYETVSLTYYADGVLADEFDERIENVEELVCEESLTHFGDYEDDSVFVRNEELKKDFEILFDTRNYSDVVGA